MSFLLTALGAAFAAMYEAIPSLPLAIVAMTLALHLLTFPLARRTFRMQGALAALQPELQRLRDEHGDDAVQLRRSTSALLREHGLPGAGSGCVAMLLQAPVFIVMFQLLRSIAGGSAHHLPDGLDLAIAVRSGSALRVHGLDLGQTGLAAMAASPWSAAAFLAILAVVVVAPIVQQRFGRGSVGRDSRATPHPLENLVPWMVPVSAGIAAIFFPVAITIFSASAALARLVQQTVLVRTARPRTA